MDMILRITLLFIFVTSCGLSPGFKKEPTTFENLKDNSLGRNGVSLHFYDINKMNVDALPRIADIKKKNKKRFKRINR